MQRRLISVAAAGAIGLAGVTSGVVLAPTLASATTGEESVAGAAGSRLSEIKNALARLVDDGTISQAQADKVAATLDRELPRHGHGHGGVRKVRLSSAADALGVDVAELREQLHAGNSLADIAKAQGVAVDTLVSKLVAAAEKALADAVADGHLTQGQADARKGNLKARITEMVNRAGPPQHRGRHHGGGTAGGHGPVTDSGSAPTRA